METDAGLIADARRGSGDALAALYRKYWPTAWQWAYAITGNRDRADDLAQEAFMSAADALSRFDVERPFGPWLKRILLNAAIDDIRRLRRSPVPLDWFEDLRSAASVDEELDTGALVDAVRALAPARRLVVVLHYWLDLKVDEIAALLALPYGTVASRLSRGLADVRAALEEQRV